MPKVVLTYFPVKGIAESIRMLLAYGGQEFEDIRIPQDQWPEYKPKTPFGQLPVLEIDGKTLTQSISIARYLGHKYNLAGANIDENFEIDQNIEYFNDLRYKLGAVAYESDPELKKKKHEENWKEVYPTMLKRIHDILVKNNGHVALGKLTWGDFVIAGIWEAIKWMLQKPDLDTQYPAFKQLTDKVRSLPKVKEWVAKAPVTEF
ncbi:glutathione S-transferase 2-like [Pectinophora gossypiella]|uniref:glutathione S-transferase 2-like n=1 Tax=Pectinophora gossypiella TaxID=13191 RepID=UPI00214E9579|nr:glutathione S-transferase 2-like [Pectinophora gossypiella]